MKSSIQMYGIIIAFSIFLFIIPQLVGIAMLYRQINSIASYLVEVIEVHEGISEHNGASENIQEKLEEYPSVKCEVDKDEIDRFYTYSIRCSKKGNVSILNIPFDVSIKKVTRRVIY